VEQKLRQAWHRERRFHTTRGICHFLLWLGALILVDFLVDWLFLLPGYGRLALLVLNVGTLLLVLYRSWWRHLRPYNPVRIALQVERRHPDLKSLLVSYIQFADVKADAEHMSPQLIEATRRLAVEATRPIDFREIIHWRDITRVSLFSAGVVLFCGALSLNWPEFFSTLFYRLLNPGASIGYPTRTHLESVTGNLTVPQGSPVTLQAACSGMVPLNGTLSIRPQEGEWENLIMPQAADRTFAYRFEQVARGFSYRVRLGDARSEDFQVRVVPPPHVLKTRVRLHYPPYTKWPDRQTDTLHLEVPEGTEVAADLVCDRALAAALVVYEDGTTGPVRLSEDGCLASVGWTVTKSFPFHFRWTGKEEGFVYEGEMTYFVKALTDTPPEVEIVFPTEDDKATVGKKLALRFRAGDDYGIAKAAIVYSLNGGEEQRRPIGDFDRAAIDEQAAWKLKDTLTGLKEGDTLAFAVEVTDNRTGEGGANVARSRPLRLDIVSVAEYLRHILEKREQLYKEIEAMHEDETGASTEVKTMRQEAGGPAPSAPAAPAAPSPGTPTPAATAPPPAPSR
jgi:hypothetical protein